MKVHEPEGFGESWWLVDEMHRKFVPLRMETRQQNGQNLRFSLGLSLGSILKVYLKNNLESVKHFHKIEQ